MGIMRLGYVHIRVTDVEEATKHYRDTLGMEVTADADGRRYFKGWDEWDHHSVVIEGGGVGMVKLGMKCASYADIETFERRIANFGATSQRMSKGESYGVSDGLRVMLPSDHVLELYTSMEFMGTEVGTYSPKPAPRNPRGVMVPRLDHCLIAAEDPALMEKFFMECLGFNVSERLITNPSEQHLIGSWMFAGQTPHDIAVIQGEQGKMHHFAYYLEDWNQILRAGDVLSDDDTSVDYGPTRHGITRGGTIYFFDPAGNRNEVFTGGYRTNPDFPTITWTMEEFPRGLSSIQREINESFLSVFT